MPFNHFTLTHIQDLNAHPAFVHRVTEYVPVLGVRRRNLLLFHERIDVDDLVS
ncbi:hypothetical protein D3C73_1536940 [compost metagenome]